MAVRREHQSWKKEARVYLQKAAFMTTTRGATMKHKAKQKTMGSGPRLDSAKAIMEELQNIGRCPSLRHPSVSV